MRYKKVSPRIDIKVIDSETDVDLITISNRNWMNMGEIFVDGCVDQMMKTEFETEGMPKKIIVVAVSEYILVND